MRTETIRRNRAGGLHRCMEETDPEDLRKAYKREKDPRVGARMAAVNMVRVKEVDSGNLPTT